MASKKTRVTKQTRRFHLEFSTTSAFFWSLGLFFLLGWIFFLGILVGRGFFPEGIRTLTELKAQIASLQNMVKGQDTPNPGPVKKPAGNPKFRFYEELSSKKANARKTLASVPRPRDDLDKRVAALEKALKKRAAPEKNARKSWESPGFTVQVASLTTAAEAARMTDRLKRLGYPAVYLKASVKGKTYYRVHCGSFRTRSEAVKLRDLPTREEKLGGFVTVMK